MISIDGAGLIAQVIPVALILIAIDGRAVLHVRATKDAWRIADIVTRWICVAAVFASIVVEVICISSVSSGTAIRGGLAVTVTILSNVIWAGAGAALGALLARGLSNSD